MEVFENTSAAELGRASAGAAQGPLMLAVFAENVGERARNSRGRPDPSRAGVSGGALTKTKTN